jgi:hypothetical protein
VYRLSQLDRWRAPGILTISCGKRPQRIHVTNRTNPFADSVGVLRSRRHAGQVNPLEMARNKAVRELVEQSKHSFDSRTACEADAKAHGFTVD